MDRHSIRACRALADCRNCISKADNLRPFLKKKYGYRLTYSSHLNELKLLHVIIFQLFFVRSTRRGKALTIAVRCIGNQWLIQDKLVKLEVLARSMSTEELVQRLILSQCIIHLDQMVRQ